MATLSQDSDFEEEEDFEVGLSFYQQGQQNIAVNHKSYDDIEKYFEELIQNTQKEYSISSGRALLFLSRNSYDESKLQIITDHKLLDLVYLNPPKNIQDQANQNMCLLCFDSLDENNRYSLECKHYFCRDCFSQYISEVFKEGQFCIFKTCALDGCFERIGIEDFKEFLPEEKFKLYQKFIIKDALGQSEKIVSCPQPNCPYVQISTKDQMIKLQQQNITCLCKYEYCNQCKEIGHYPCNCGDFRKWLSKMESYGTSSDLNDEWFIMNTKPCPKCKILIEKNQGCMHMTCKQCQHHFCWICLGDWKGHNDYYNCSKFDQEKLNQLQREKIELSHFKFHQGQYSHHLSNIQVVQKEIDQIIEYFNGLNERLAKQQQKTINLELIIKFCQQVLRGRKYLPFFYAKGYSITDTQKLKFFNDLIEDYVRIIEDFNAQLQSLKKEEVEDSTENLNQNKIILKKSFYQYQDNLSKKLTSISKYINQKLKQFTEDLDKLEIITEKKLGLYPIWSVDEYKKLQQKQNEKTAKKVEQKQKNEKPPAQEQKIQQQQQQQQQQNIVQQDQDDLNKKRKVQFSNNLDYEEMDLGNTQKKKQKPNDSLEEIPSKKEINSSQSVIIYRSISENAPIICIDCGENPATNEYGVCDSCFDSLNN